MQIITSNRQRVLFSLFFTQLVLHFLEMTGRRGNGIALCRLNQLHQHIGRNAMLTHHADDVCVLDSDDIRIDLFVSRLEGGDFLAVLLTLLTKLDYFSINFTSLRVWQQTKC